MAFFPSRSRPQVLKRTPGCDNFYEEETDFYEEVQMSVTQQDVAVRLGISQRTVAFALSDVPQARKQVAAATRQRVRQIAAEMGYRPHRYAQVMRTGKSNLLGLVRCRSPFQTLEDRASFAAQAIRRLGYQDLSYDIGWQSDELGTACDALIDARVEGVLLTGPDSRFPLPHIKRLRAAGIAVVSFMSRAFPGVPRVLADNRQGMELLLRHLLDLGYRRLTLLAPEPAQSSDPERADSVSERVRGFQETVAAAGLTEAEIEYQPVGEDRNDPYEFGYHAAARVLAKARRPEVLVGINDYAAVGAFKACADREVRVPQELAVVGFDNVNLGRYTPAALTTVEQPIEAMAEAAVTLLLQLIQGQKVPASQMLVKLPCRLIVRQSCGTPAQEPVPQA